MLDTVFFFFLIKESVAPLPPTHLEFKSSSSYLAQNFLKWCLWLKLGRGSFARMAIIAECIRLVRMDGTYRPYYGKMLNYRHRNYIAMWGSNEMP